ncbi:hypothetical protein INR49_004499 [Caranx melampygus]|nr:hypothetical protein INR49_004499 [Caranx melampygus]
MNAAAAGEGAKAAPPKFKQKETGSSRARLPKMDKRGLTTTSQEWRVLETLRGLPLGGFGDMELSDLAQFGIV